MAIQDFDDMLPHVGGFGVFQKRILLVSLPVNYFLAVVYMAQIYITFVPEHSCRVPDLTNLPPDIRKNLSLPLEERDGASQYSRCNMYDVNYTEILESNLLVPNISWPVTKCQYGWDYEFTGGLYPTIVTEGNWVCDDDWRTNFAQAMFFAGAIVGSLLFGLMADYLGRLPVLVVSHMLAAVAGIATGFAKSFVVFVACRFLVGMAYDLHYMMMYIILMEYVGPDKRTLVGNVPLAVFLTLGAVTLPWIAYALHDWRLYCFITSAPLAITVIAPWVVPESARWLLLRGKIDKCLDILRRCAMLNDKKVPEHVYEEFKVAAIKAYEEEKLKESNWLDLFRTPKMRSRMFLMIFAWMIITLVYDGHVRSLGILPYSPFVTFSFAGSLELPADLVPLIILDTLGRRWSCFSALGLSGIFGIASGLVPLDYPLTIAGLAMAGRFCITIAMNAGVQYTVELVPTQLRGQGVSAVHITGHCATFFAPFILYLSAYSRTLPYIILGAISIVGGFVCLLLPETAGEFLPESVEDADAFAANQKFWDIPMLRDRRRQREQSLGDENGNPVATNDSKPDKKEGQTNSGFELQEDRQITSL